MWDKSKTTGAVGIAQFSHKLRNTDRYNIWIFEFAVAEKGIFRYNYVNNNTPDALATAMV